MLTDDVKRYIELRQALGFKCEEVKSQLLSFSAYHDGLMREYIRADDVEIWARRCGDASSSKRKISAIKNFTRFLSAENPRHQLAQIETLYIGRR